jgi:hypothetical protein
MSNIYIENGYNNRVDYLKSLANDYAIDFIIVKEMAIQLGMSEDFDGLISFLEDMSEENSQNETEEVDYILSYYG